MRRIIERVTARLGNALVVAMLAIISSAGVLAVPSIAHAVSPYGNACDGGGGNSAICQSQNSTADPIAGQNGAIVSVTTILAIVAGVVSVIFIIIGGIKYVTSGGDSSGVSSAKNTIIAALIGLIIAALAKPIVTYVVGKL